MHVSCMSKVINLIAALLSRINVLLEEIIISYFLFLVSCTQVCYGRIEARRGVLWFDKVCD